MGGDHSYSSCKLRKVSSNSWEMLFFLSIYHKSIFQQEFRNVKTVTERCTLMWLFELKNEFKYFLVENKYYLTVRFGIEAHHGM